MYYRRALLPVWRFCIFWFLGVAVLYGPDVYRELTAIGAAEVRDHSTKKREAISISNEELLVACEGALSGSCCARVATTGNAAFGAARSVECEGSSPRPSRCEGSPP